MGNPGLPMKPILSAVASLVILACTAVSRAEAPAIAASPADEIEILVAPIALYPDPLIALILPASTRPAEIVLAARFLDRGGNAEAAQHEPWDDSVRALTRYREVVEYLDRHLDWTRRLGEAFMDRPDDVMDAIQSARTRARANGLLPDTPQQTVIVETDEIRIVPATPTVIYVPRYDPEIIYVTSRSRFHPSAWLSFGIGYGVGSWLNYDCDWRYRSVRIMHRPPTWYHQPDWHRRRVEPTMWTRWTPRPRRDRDHDHHAGSLATSPDYPRRDPLDRRRGNAGSHDAPAFPHNQPAPTPRFDDAHRVRQFGGTRDFDRNRYDRDRSPRHSDRHSPRRSQPSPDAPPLSAPAIVATPPPGPTAASIVSTPPPGPTAPAIVSQPAGANFHSSPRQTWSQPRPPRHPEGERERRFDPPRREPRRDDADATDRTGPRAPSESRPERSARWDRRHSNEPER